MRKAFVNDIATELIKMTAVRYALKVFHLRVLALASPDIKNSLQNLFLVVSFSFPAVHNKNVWNILASKTYCKLHFQVPYGSNIDLKKKRKPQSKFKKNNWRSTKYIKKPHYLLNPLEWLASNFSLQNHYWIKYKGHENMG